MKYMLIFISCASCSFAHSQTDSTARNIPLKIMITDLHGQSLTGFLHSVTDSVIIFTRTHSRTYQESVLPHVNISYHEIERVILKRQRSAGRGAAFGMLGGVVVGAIIGGASYKDPGPNAFIDLGPGLGTMAGGGIGLVSGGMIGLVSGAFAEKKFIIGGRKDKFDQLRNHTRRRLFR